MMKALLLAAGLGARLRPITDNLPKCLVDINGKPLLSYWFDLLFENGINEILVNTHYLAHQVESFSKKSKYYDFLTLVNEEKLLGTGGTLLKNRRFFQGEPLMLVHADNLSSFDVSKFMRTYQNRPENIEITMLTFTTDAPSTCGILELDENGVVTAMHEKTKKPPGNLANGAVYILSDSVVSYMASLGKELVDFSTEVLPNYLGCINTYHNDIYHRDIGNLTSLNKARVEYQNQISYK